MGVAIVPMPMVVDIAVKSALRGSIVLTSARYAIERGEINVRSIIGILRNWIKRVLKLSNKPAKRIMSDGMIKIVSPNTLSASRVIMKCPCV